MTELHARCDIIFFKSTTLLFVIKYQLDCVKLLSDLLYIIPQHTSHTAQKKDENHNKLVTDICSYVKLLAAKLQDELQKVAVVGFVVTVQYHNISNPTVGCVVFIITSFHKTLMTLMTNWDLMKLNDFLLN